MNNSGNGNINGSPNNTGCLSGFGIYGALFVAVILTIIISKIFSFGDSLTFLIINIIVGLAILVTVIKIALKIKQAIDSHKAKKAAAMLAQRKKAAEELRKHSNWTKIRASTLNTDINSYDMQTSSECFKKQKEVWEVLSRAYIADSELKEIIKEIEEQ